MTINELTNEDYSFNQIILLLNTYKIPYDTENFAIHSKYIELINILIAFKSLHVPDQFSKEFSAYYKDGDITLYERYEILTTIMNTCPDEYQDTIPFSKITKLMKYYKKILSSTCS